MVVRKTTVTDFVAAGVVILFTLLCVLPMALIFMVSITEESAVMANGYQFVPEEFSLESYRVLFSNSQIGESYIVSLIVVTVGTITAVLITYMAAFTLANKRIPYRNALALFFFVTMVFNPGLVPWYMMNRFLGLKDNIWALIIPRLLFSPFNLFLVRNFLAGIPDSLMESAIMDGARDDTIAFRVYLPLSGPVVATVALFYGIAYWNDWFNAIMLIDAADIRPLQYLLFLLQSELNMLAELADANLSVTPPKESFKMATAIMTIGPIVLFYPYLQRYFIKCLIVGSIKG